MPDLAVSIAVRIHKGAREVVDLLLAANRVTARVPPRAQWSGEHLSVHRSPIDSLRDPGNCLAVTPETASHPSKYKVGAV